jgi:hypothetical protein
MRKRILALLIGAAGVMGLGAGGSAFAECGKGKAIVSDTFETLDSASWGAANDQQFVEKGWLQIKPKPGYTYQILSQSDFYGDGSLCGEVKIVETGNLDATNGGLVFWATDYSNYYKVTVGPSENQGGFWVSRLTKGRWLTPVSWTVDPVIKAKLGDVNRIEVQMKGRTATIFINGKQLAQFNGFPPEGGGLIGVSGGAPEPGGAKIAFDNVEFTAAAGFRP